MAETVLSDLLRTVKHKIRSNIKLNTKTLPVKVAVPSFIYETNKQPQIVLVFVFSTLDLTRWTCDRVVKNINTEELTADIYSNKKPYNFTLYINIHANRIVWLLDLLSQVENYFDEYPNFYLEANSDKEVRILHREKDVRDIGSGENLVKQFEIICQTNIDGRLVTEGAKLVSSIVQEINDEEV